MKKTKITITITVERDGEESKRFEQVAESTNDGSGTALWTTIVTGLELVMSKVHRVLFPDTEEAEDAGNPTTTNAPDANA